MTIASSTNRVSFNGNGSTVAFAVSFPFQLQADLVVLSTVIATGVSTTQTLTTDYTISGSTDSLGFYPNGGTVTFLVAPANTVRITIYRDPARTQGLDLVENDSLPAESVEAQLDDLTMQVQRLADLIVRTVRQPDGDANALAALPSSVDRANHYLSCDANGDIIASATVSAASVSVSSFMQTVLAAASAAAARALLGAPASTGGVMTTGTVAADPSAALGIPSKQYIDARTGTVASYTGTANLADGVGLARLSGASFVLTLPAVASSTDRKVTILHRGTSLTQVYTIKGNSSDSLIAPDGTANTYLLYTAGESVTWECDGANWYLAHHRAITDWADVGVMTITGTSVNPTKPTTPDIDKVYWRRDGNRVFLRYILQISSAAGSAAGTGTYLFATPTNITFDTTVLTPVATAIASAVISEAASSFLSSTAHSGIDTVSFSHCDLYAYNTSHFQAWRPDAGPIGDTFHPLTSAELSYTFELNARAANWRL